MRGCRHLSSWVSSKDIFSLSFLKHYTLKVSTDGLASFGFSPCYNCDFAYQFKIGGGTDNKDISIFVDGVLSTSETALFNPLR